MRLLIDDEFLELTDADMAWLYLGSGNESKVYKYGDDELEDIICEVVFETIDNSNLVEKEGKNGVFCFICLMTALC